MAINEQWLPIIGTGLSWIKDNLGPSKKELSMKISELEKQIEKLTASNALSTSQARLITQAILSQLRAENSFTINADTIVFVGTNNGTVKTANPVIKDSNVQGNIVDQHQETEAKFDITKIFDGLDEEIAHARMQKPNNRR